MARNKGDGQAEQAPLRLDTVYVPADSLYPNPWNVNEMTKEMFSKEVASIQAFGFIDPILVRAHPWEPKAWQIIDGEHRWRAGMSLGMGAFPVNVIIASDEAAQQLSIILNETRGTANSAKLSELVRSLAQRTDPEVLQQLLPFDRARFDEMVAGFTEQKLDFDALSGKLKSMDRESGWVERVFRMPSDSATVVDDALARIMDSEQIEESWRALELMAADYLSSG